MPNAIQMLKCCYLCFGVFCFDIACANTERIKYYPKWQRTIKKGTNHF